jgi:hypothetical protein
VQLDDLTNRRAAELTASQSMERFIDQVRLFHNPASNGSLGVALHTYGPGDARGIDTANDRNLGVHVGEYLLAWSAMAQVVQF